MDSILKDQIKNELSRRLGRVKNDDIKGIDIKITKIINDILNEKNVEFKDEKEKHELISHLKSTNIKALQNAMRNTIRKAFKGFSKI